LLHVTFSPVSHPLNPVHMLRYKVLSITV